MWALGAHSTVHSEYIKVKHPLILSAEFSKIIIIHIAARWRKDLPPRRTHKFGTAARATSASALFSDDE